MRARGSDELDLPIAGKEIETLGRAYKQLNAPVGEFALATLEIVTRAIACGSAANDASSIETSRALDALANVRDQLSERIERVLEGAWFEHREADLQEVRALHLEANALIRVTKAFAAARCGSVARNGPQDADPRNGSNWKSASTLE